MHAAVLDAAEQLGLRFSFVSSVSGGSIIGGFYTAGGAPRDFLNAFAEGRFQIVRTAVRIQNLVRLSSRLKIQAELLNAVIFKDLSLADLARTDGPKLIICATDLREGHSVGLGPSFTLIRHALYPNEKRKYCNMYIPPNFSTTEYFPYVEGFAASCPAAKLIGASGAFPLAFNPISLDIPYHDFTSEETNKLLLSDGGISDNTGVDLLLDAHRELTGTVPLYKSPHGYQYPTLSGWTMDLVIASDATAVFVPAESQNALTGFSRAVDNIYRNTKSRDIYPPVRPPAVFLLSPDVHLSSMRTAERDLRLRLMRSISTFTLNDVPTLRLMTERLPSYPISSDNPLAKEFERRGISEAAKDARRFGLSLLAGAQATNGTVEIPVHNRVLVEEMLLADYSHCLEVFSTASTLQAEFSDEVSHARHRLGAYLIYLNWPLLDVQLNTVSMYKRTAEDEWLKVNSAAEKIFGVGYQLPRFDAENDILEKFGKTMPTANGRVSTLDDMARMLSNSESNYQTLINACQMQKAALAHRVAHAVRHVQKPGNEYFADRSLIDEILGQLPLDEDEETEVDEMTYRILAEAGMETSGIALLFTQSLKKFGTDNVHREVAQRLTAHIFRHPFSHAQDGNSAPSLSNPASPLKD
jgi:predicted acylesterase/phospholipase RssA